jgi:Tol biopolymer transport system component
MEKRTTRIGHSLLLSLALLAGCAGDEEHLEVAYSTIREEVPTRIVVVQDDGKKARRVTGAKFRANPVLPKWSPDGQRIAFVRTDPAGGPNAFDTYVVNADGSGERRLGRGTLPVWTNDGRSVIAERLSMPGQNSRIYVYPVGGGAGRMLARGSGPVVSHNGSRVAFVRFTERRLPNGDFVTTSTSLYTIGVNGRGLRLLARTTERNVRWVQPAWLPDDSAVAVVQRRGGEAGSGPLLTFSMNGQRRTVVPQVGETFDWSPTGNLVAYTLGENLTIIRPDGTEVGTYGNSPAIDIEWSPDGAMVAFAIPEVLQTGQFVGIYVVEVEEETRRRFVIAEGFAAFFDWRPKPPEKD